VSTTADRGNDWATWFARQRDEVVAAGRWRTPRTFDAHGPTGVLTATGQTVVSFASNDYLGLANHPVVAAAAIAAVERWGTGSGASRLVVGSRPVHAELEAELAAWKGTDAAVLFPTGFAANLGVLTTVGGPGVRICSDELNHASIVDGCRLARAEACVFAHCDLDHLDHLLRDAPGRAVVVSDTVFSMDGDEAPVAELAERCRRAGALLVLDEAHAVLGPAAADDLGDTDVVRVGTLSKTLGSLGGFVAAPGGWADLLVNRARSYIFTTASSPADAAAALAALRIVRGPEGDDLRARLARHVQALHPGHRSPILPVIVGDERAALDAADELLARGLLVPAIRPPTVPAGTSRLRVALSAAHTDEQVAALGTALTELGLVP